MKHILLLYCLLISFTFLAQVERNSSEQTPAKKASPAVKQDSNSLDDDIAPNNSVQENRSQQILDATRFLSTQKNTTAYSVQERADLIKELARTNPNSAEYYFNVYLASGRKNADLGLLKKAYEKTPTDINVLEEMAGNAVRTNQLTIAKKYLKELMTSGSLDLDLVNYFKDLFQLAPKNSVLIFHGFDDSYNALYVQQILLVRPDIKIINLDWLTISDYRAELKNSGFFVPSEVIVNPDYLRNFIDKNPTKSMGISLTLPKAYLEKLPHNATVIGTAFWTNTKPSSNSNLSDFTFIISKPKNEQAISWAKNYLPFLYSYRGQLLTNKDTNGAKAIENKMIEIGKWNNQQTKISSVLQQ
ncbi:MAG: hypothetical protein ABI207_05055 [Crocinitomicaceae bacterium]